MDNCQKKIGWSCLGSHNRWFNFKRLSYRVAVSVKVPISLLFVFLTWNPFVFLKAFHVKKS